MIYFKARILQVSFFFFFWYEGYLWKTPLGPLTPLGGKYRQFFLNLCQLNFDLKNFTTRILQVFFSLFDMEGISEKRRFGPSSPANIEILKMHVCDILVFYIWKQESYKYLFFFYLRIEGYVKKMFWAPSPLSGTWIDYTPPLPPVFTDPTEIFVIYVVILYVEIMFCNLNFFNL